MKFELSVLSLIFVCIFIKTSFADLTIGKFEHPNHPGHCVMEQMVLSPGSVAKHPDMCAKITCHRNSKASIVTCSAMVPPPGCKLGDPVDPEAHYPNCCRKKIICENGISFNS